MFYIQRKTTNELETVDQFDTYKEASRMCNEYNISDPVARYYVSRRPCKSWNSD
jgi:hypothetical protein